MVKTRLRLELPMSRLQGLRADKTNGNEEEGEAGCFCSVQTWRDPERAALQSATRARVDEGPGREQVHLRQPSYQPVEYIKFVIGNKSLGMMGSSDREISENRIPAIKRDGRRTASRK